MTNYAYLTSKIVEDAKKKGEDYYFGVPSTNETFLAKVSAYKDNIVTLERPNDGGKIFEKLTNLIIYY